MKNSRISESFDMGHERIPVPFEAAVPRKGTLTNSLRPNNVNLEEY